MSRGGYRLIAAVCACVAKYSANDIAVGALSS
jgi:hypothetical protein